METQAMALAWLWYTRGDWKLYRLLHGGLWVQFEHQPWMKFKWHLSLEHHQQYIVHPQGGTFSVKFKEITGLENYSWGHIK